MNIHGPVRSTPPLPTGALLRLFECDWYWSMTGAGEFSHQRLANCVANELSNSFNRCGRATSSVLPGRQGALMQLERGTLALVISPKNARFDGAFPHDISSSLNHCQHLYAEQVTRCNASQSGWSAEVYAARRYESVLRACERNANSWGAHVQFMRENNETKCVHASRAEAERYQIAFLSLLERRPLPPQRRGRVCDPGPLWNQLHTRWKLNDVIGVAHSADAAGAAKQVRAAIQHITRIFQTNESSEVRPVPAPGMWLLSASQVDSLR